MADYSLLQHLCERRGISGREEEVRAAVLAEIVPYCQVKTDRLGNIIAYKKGKRTPQKKLMLSAHMDEVGLIITHITEDGYLRFQKVGGIDDKILAGIPVEVGEQGVYGVIGAKAIHLLTQEERKLPPDSAQMNIDIGALSREEAMSVVAPGDVASFSSMFRRREGKIISKALDDRAGCAILIELIRTELEYDMTFVFTVQEEVGLRGAKTAAFSVAPDAAIVVESTTAADISGVPKHKQVCRMGDGPVISFMDGHTIYDREYYQLAFALAQKYGIACQAKEAIAGGNDAGVIHTSRTGVRTVAVSLPCRYLHAPASMIAEADYEASLLLVRHLAETICAGMDKAL